jgi:hypothetical protein
MTARLLRPAHCFSVTGKTTGKETFPMTEETGLTQDRQDEAIAYVRNPHPSLQPGSQTMDLCELGARRLVNWLERNGYIVVKAESQP